MFTNLDFEQEISLGEEIQIAPVAQNSYYWTSDVCSRSMYNTSQIQSENNLCFTFHWIMVYH